jgi:hypothetical protein
MTLKSTRKPLILERFNTMSGAVDRLKRLSDGYDASSFVAEQLVVESNNDKSKAEQIAAQRSIVEQLTGRRKEIDALIAEEKLSTEPSAQVLEKLSQARQLNEAFIVEQDTILQELLN